MFDPLEESASKKDQQTLILFTGDPNGPTHDDRLLHIPSSNYILYKSDRFDRILNLADSILMRIIMKRAHHKDELFSW